MSLGFNTLMWPFKRPKSRIYRPPPPSPHAPAALQALRGVPGPSPWYLDGLPIQSSHGLLGWRSAGHKGPFAGKCFLTKSDGAQVAIADSNCYVRAVADHRMLVWYLATADTVSRLRLELFDTDRLVPMSDLGPLLSQLNPSRRLLTLSEPVAAFEIPTALADGPHVLSIPAPFRDLGELLMLAASPSDGRREDHFNAMHQRLWIVDCGTGALEIAAQDWFNHGPYDFGYQWITRMARLPRSADIVGEGIRLGVFRLDPLHRQVAEWLVTDTFYHPERAV